VRSLLSDELASYPRATGGDSDDSWLLYAVRIVVSEPLRPIDTGGDVARNVNGSITSSRLTTWIAGEGDTTRAGEVYPEL